MKLSNILGTVLASTVVVLGFSGMAASADVVEGKTAETPANVSIIDQTGPVDPTDPDQTRLTLDKVPEAYNFETLIKNKAYSVNGTLTNQSVVVFNDYTDQDWAVKASVVGNKITADNDAQTEFDVTGFKINDVTVVGTGATGIVAKNAETKTTESNTGELITAINSANIEFTDGDNVLKVGNKLSGTISYQLYNTATAD